MLRVLNEGHGLGRSVLQNLREYGMGVWLCGEIRQEQCVLLPRRLRKSVMMLSAFFMSYCLAWLSVYCVRVRWKM
jgi:hypothetical protein